MTYERESNAGTAIWMKESAEGELVQESVAIPVDKLLQYYRYHLAALQELSGLLGAELLDGFTDELTKLAQYVRQEPQFLAATASTPQGSATSELPEEERPEIVALLQAVQRNPDSIRRMTDLPEVVLLAAVDRMGTAVRHIANPSEAVQMAAVRRNPWAIKRIKHPAPAVIAYALERAPELQRHFDRVSHARRNRTIASEEEASV